MVMPLMISKHFRFSHICICNHTLFSSNVWYIVQFRGIDISISKSVKSALLRNRWHKNKNSNYTSKISFRPTGMSYFVWKSRHSALDLTWIGDTIALKTNAYIVIWLHFFQKYNKNPENDMSLHRFWGELHAMITPSNYLHAKWNVALDGSIKDQQSVTSCLLFTGTCHFIQRFHSQCQHYYLKPVIALCSSYLRR